MEIYFNQTHTAFIIVVNGIRQKFDNTGGRMTNKKKVLDCGGNHMEYEHEWESQWGIVQQRYDGQYYLDGMRLEKAHIPSFHRFEQVSEEGLFPSPYRPAKYVCTGKEFLVIETKTSVIPLFVEELLKKGFLIEDIF
ncbi:MAG: hypothetical protein WAV73_04650 [Candidatus Moraniibacteriota bacterium]